MRPSPDWLPLYFDSPVTWELLYTTSRQGTEADDSAAWCQEWMSQPLLAPGWKMLLLNGCKVKHRSESKGQTNNCWPTRLSAFLKQWLTMHSHLLLFLWVTTKWKSYFRRSVGSEKSRLVCFQHFDQQVLVVFSKLLEGMVIAWPNFT